MKNNIYSFTSLSMGRFENPSDAAHRIGYSFVEESVEIPSAYICNPSAEIYEHTGKGNRP